MIYIDFKYCDTAGIVNMEMTEWLKQHIGAGRPRWRYRFLNQDLKRYYPGPMGVYFRYPEDALAFKIRYML